MGKYRVIYACDRCETVSKTIAKPSASAPNRCKKCNSTRTRKIRHIKVDTAEK